MSSCGFVVALLHCVMISLEPMEIDHMQALYKCPDGVAVAIMACH